MSSPAHHPEESDISQVGDSLELDSDSYTWAKSMESRQLPRRTHSIGSITSLSHSQPLFSPASSLFYLTESGRTGGLERQNRNVTLQPTLRKRPRIENLQQHRSTSNLHREDHPAQSDKRISVKIPARRCVSADAAIRARSRFSSPDRYITQRTGPGQRNALFRANKPPAQLRGRELRFRRRNHAIDPFRSFSDRRSEAIVRRQHGNHRYRLSIPHYTPSFVYGSAAGPLQPNDRSSAESIRQLSWGGFWTVGGRTGAHIGQLHAVPTVGGSLLASGTIASVHTPPFLDQPTRDDKMLAHESRLALAMDIDQSSKILDHDLTAMSAQLPVLSRHRPFKWQAGEWTRDHGTRNMNMKRPQLARPEKAVPTVAFRVLDAPHLKDDYYCTILAYCYASRTLAVALTHKVYLWTEQQGVRYPPLPPARAANFVTSLAFSSEEGHKSILAVARHNGNVTLWSLHEPRPRFEAPHPSPASCVAFRPKVAHRQSSSQSHNVTCEDLLVGDDSGRIYYYSVEWPDFEAGSMTLLTKLEAHNQNICGLVWSPDGLKFVSGGNDNVALLFDIETVLTHDTLNTVAEDTDFDEEEEVVPIHITQHEYERTGSATILTPPVSPNRTLDFEAVPLFEVFDAVVERHGTEPRTPPATPNVITPPREQDHIQLRSSEQSLTTATSMRSTQHTSLLRNGLASPGIRGSTNLHEFSFYHSAAVKAIAFAPWQPTLLATGGGSNDRQIHFHHTSSGATLALINVFAQVTSLTWSTTRREIAATFGYAQPDHDDRKLNGEVGRALWAIPYPGGPNDAVPTRIQADSEGLTAWETIRSREQDRRQDRVLEPENLLEVDGRSRAPSPEEESRGRNIHRSPSINRQRTRTRRSSRSRLRGEGDMWASRTEEEGSLIIACCDQTVKFFEIWAGKSKGRGHGLGTKPGVLGGSSVLEGLCEEIGLDIIGKQESVIR